MEVFGGTETLDGGDRIVFVHHREGEARIDATTIHEHGAGPALAVVAAFLRSGKREMIAAGIEQGRTRIDVERVVPAVN
uniref:Uncharacterized protein n=1 Tax=Fulvimarina pelagi TaxID=217511 RepID=A0A0P0ZA96_9HYPH|nr:hypothetical protein [Fulvimarina pelagi]